MTDNTSAPPLDLDAITKRARLAVPPPWGTDDEAVVCFAPSDNRPELGEYTVAHVGDRDDREFIAHAREDVPDLLARVRVLTAKLDATAQAFDDLVAQVWRATGEEHEPPADVAALLAAVTGLRTARDAAREVLRFVARTDDPPAAMKTMRERLAALLRYEHGNSHGHSRVATWDRDNRAPVGNAPCARCHAFADAREAIGLPRWPTVEEHHRASYRRESDAEMVCSHTAECGCGGDVYSNCPTITVTDPTPRGEP